MNSNDLNSMLEIPIVENNFERNYPALVTLLASMTSSSSSIIDDKVVFLKEIQRISILKEWESTWHFFALSNALGINIRQVYPDIKDMHESNAFLFTVKTQLE